MPVERESLWSRKRSAWHRDAARTRIAEESWLLLYFFVFAALFLALLGLRSLSAPLGWAALGAAAACLVVFWGLRAGREWARWVGGVLAALLALSNFVGLFFAHDWTWYQWVWALLLPLLWASVAWSLLKASARPLFARARSRD